MKKLIKMLQKAHAVEVGAYAAYEGHWRSTLPITSVVRGEIKWIQVDELLHKEQIEKMLARLEAKPNRILDWMFGVVGKIISMSCYVLPAKLAAYGAELIESIGKNDYLQLVLEAEGQGMPDMAQELFTIWCAELKHELYMNKLRSVQRK